MEKDWNIIKTILENNIEKHQKLLDSSNKEDMKIRNCFSTLNKYIKKGISNLDALEKNDFNINKRKILEYFEKNGWK